MAAAVLLDLNRSSAPASCISPDAERSAQTLHQGAATDWPCLFWQWPLIAIDSTYTQYD
jgi:hypothetical protein